MSIYLDNNATTALDERVLEAMLPYLGQVTGNPSSVHRFGRLQKDAIEQARYSVAQLVGSRAEQVVFTSGGTESNNLLVKGYTEQALQEGLNASIAMGATEHMSMIEPIQQAAIPVSTIAVDYNGILDVDSFDQAVSQQDTLVSVMTANNETGVIQPLEPFIKNAVNKNCYFHSDASQAAGKIKLDFAASGLHAMTLSAHKLYGPAGVGALVIDKRLPLCKQMHGGVQENNLRAGTENVASIVGFGKAAELAVSELESRSIHARQLRDALELGLSKLSDISIFSECAERLPNTVQFGVKGFEGETLLMQLDRKVIAVSSGSACTSGKTEPSHVLKAMNVPDVIANSAIRVSFGNNNSLSDVDDLLNALAEIIEVKQDSAVMMAASV